MKTHTVVAPDNVYELLSDPDVNVGDEIEYETNNQEGYTPFLISNAHFYKLLFFYKNYLKMYYYIVLVK